MKANPAVVVGMCSTMHAELKKASLYNEELNFARFYEEYEVPVPDLTWTG